MIKLDSHSDEETNDSEDEGFNEPVLSLNALSGNQTFQTMRVKGLVGSKLFHILVDSGSTHNFLDLDLARDGLQNRKHSSSACCSS